VIGIRSRLWLKIDDIGMAAIQCGIASKYPRSFQGRLEQIHLEGLEGQKARERLKVETVFHPSKRCEKWNVEQDQL
jgi:hypothetical protein